MPKYLIQMREVHLQDVEVHAATLQDAVLAAIDGDGEYLDLNYLHPLPVETWSAYLYDGTCVDNLEWGETDG